MIDQLDRIKQKQAIFREQKRLVEQDVSTQDEFDKYLAILKPTEDCSFMTGIKEIVSLCNNNSYSCKYRSNENYSLGKNPKKECLRANKLRFESILGKRKVSSKVKVANSSL